MSVTLAELAEELGAAVEGDGTRAIRRVAPLAEADESCLSWVSSDKYVGAAKTTQAAGILAPPGLQLNTPAAVLRVADPDLALCAVLERLAPPVPEIPPGVALSAVIAAGAQVDGAHIADGVFVGPGAVVGAGTQLHPGVYIGAEARIGRGCVLWPNVVVRERVTVGQRVVIHANSTIGADGFSYLQRDGRHVKIPQIGTVVIEDDVEIGANVCIDRARSHETRVGAGTKIDNLVQIGHNVRIEPHCIIVAQTGLAGSTTVGTGTMIGGQVGVTDHVRVGAGVRIGAQSGVLGDIADGADVAGLPAHPRGEVWRELAALRRLPDLLREVRELKKRVEQLESTTDH